ncbi:MAG: hypothetical protein ACOCYZ_06745 [Halococcoides sp.]
MADTDRPTIESRTGRLLAYLASNRDQLIVDAAVLLAWIVVSATAFRVLALPQWAHYLVLFVGIAVYAKLTPSWERPYRSPE